LTKLLIFDWDGTLCDSVSKIVTCVGLASEEQGLRLAKLDEAREVIGLGLIESFQTLFPQATHEQVMLMCSSYSSHYIRLDEKPSPLFESVMDTLLFLKNKGYILTVATGKSRKGLNRTLKARDMSDFFHGSRCADETAGKPNPLMIDEILAEFNVSVNDAVMVGDTEYDLGMAVNAGISCIGVSYGAHCSSRFKKYHPLGCIDKLSEIKNYLNQ
jgi:phosphoglycolate phosphatase